jgi:hypothetical protein
MTQPGPDLLKIVMDYLQVAISFWAQDHGQTHESTPNLAIASRHGLPDPGDASASALLWESVSKCQSGISSGDNSTGRLSQIC